ncbi:hypothetical protein [Pseudactinotalea sp. Z1748]|uniref:hypothetical protein n=1 Tax=Pseudactinotalea sp. Z1748 TaxID=3413027 RepID=UPI003C7C7201
MLAVVGNVVNHPAFAVSSGTEPHFPSWDITVEHRVFETVIRDLEFLAREPLSRGECPSRRHGHCEHHRGTERDGRT